MKRQSPFQLALIRSYLKILTQLRNKSLKENFIFCTAVSLTFVYFFRAISKKIICNGY